MGFTVVGSACAIYVEGEWSVHLDSEPDGWACYAGIEPLYLEHCQCDFLSSEYWLSREATTRAKYTARGLEWPEPPRLGGHDASCLSVVPHYSSNIESAWLVVAKMRSHANPRFRALRLVSWPYARSYATFEAEVGCEHWAEANGEYADATAICLAALGATP